MLTACHATALQQPLSLIPSAPNRFAADWRLPVDLSGSDDVPTGICEDKAEPHLHPSVDSKLRSTIAELIQDFLCRGSNCSSSAPSLATGIVV